MSSAYNSNNDDRILVGRNTELEIIKRVDFGVYLEAYDLGEILLPNRNIRGDVEVGDLVDAFIYHDSEDRLIATMKPPVAQAGEFAFLKVAETTPIGAFMEWGLDKHLFVPFAEQHSRMQEGRRYLVYIHQNQRDERLVGSSKYNKFMSESRRHRFKPRQEVDIIIESETELGIKAIINNQWWGILYRDEVFQDLCFGQRHKAWIQRVREDGKIDLSLNPGRGGHDKNCEKVLNAIADADGELPLHDKSSPHDIKKRLGMSKAAFKKAVGSLLAQKKIVFVEGGVRRAG